jgi:hypothetical protein
MTWEIVTVYQHLLLFTAKHFNRTTCGCFYKDPSIYSFIRFRHLCSESSLMSISWSPFSSFNLISWSLQFDLSFLNAKSTQKQQRKPSFRLESWGASSPHESTNHGNHGCSTCAQGSLDHESFLWRLQPRIEARTQYLCWENQGPRNSRSSWPLKEVRERAP